MSHFAEIRPNGNVVSVICAEPDVINLGVMGDPHKYIQTSFNGNFRNKFARIGDRYDRSLDMFIPPKPYPSWSLETYEEDDNKLGFIDVGLKVIDQVDNKHDS